MTVVTHVPLKRGSRARVGPPHARAHERGPEATRMDRGPVAAVAEGRVIVGTWQTRDRLGEMAPRSRVRGDPPADGRDGGRTDRPGGTRSWPRSRKRAGRNEASLEREGQELSRASV